MSTVNYSDRMLHILRNPWGFTEDQVMEARLWAGDQVERLWRTQVKSSDDLLRAVDALGVAISDAGYTWTPSMRAAYEGAVSAARHLASAAANKSSYG